PKPIVAMQEGWDLQVFSANAVPQEDDERANKIRDGMFLTLLVIISLLYWWGGRKSDQVIK
ncbi:MAG: hypothetical protein HQ568_09930, partial [Calditrichaeota bacterium]|nr:hypothetical protein [Calditrichota bacterium]